MNEVTINRTNLPTTIEDLSKFVLIGREKLVAVRAEIRAIDKVGLAEEVRKQKLQEAQAISEAVLDAEVKIGELMQAVPKVKAGMSITKRVLPTPLSRVFPHRPKPTLTMQGYFDKSSELISLAIAKTIDVMRCVDEDVGYYQHTKQLQNIQS